MTDLEPNAVNSTSEIDDSPSMRKTRNASIIEGTFAAISQVISDNYLTPYALAINASVFQIGIMNSMGGLISPLGQIFGARLMRIHRRKQNLVLFARLQSVMWFFILSIGILYIFNIVSGILPTLLLGYVIALQIFGGMIGSNWVSIMGDCIPQNSRGAYFAKRNLIVNIVALSVSISLAFWLNSLDLSQQKLIGFIFIFGCAGISRFFSSLSFILHFDPPLKITPSDYLTFRYFLQHLPKDNYGLFTIFMNLIRFAQGIAAPFFGVFMIQILHFNYTIYTLVTLSASIIALFMYRILGKFADLYGNRQLLKFGAILISFIPFMWIIFSSPFGLIFGPQLFSGIGWTAFNLASGNFIYDNIPSSKRGEYHAYFTLIAGLGTILGGLISSLLIISLPFSISLNYKILFGLSGAFRVIIVIIMIPKIREVRVTSKYIFDLQNKSFFRLFKEK